MTEEDPVFTVAIEEVTTPVTAGETATVTVAVENTGESGEQTVSLLEDDDEHASEDVELDGGDATEIELTWETTNDDVGDHDCTVETGDDSASLSVTVEDAPASFDVEITSAPEHIVSGQVVTVVATAENTGTLSGTQDIEFSVGDERQERVGDVTLEGMESDEFEFTYETTEEEDQPDIDIEVSSEDDSASQMVPVVTTSVSKLRELGSKGGMGIFGWLMFLGMVIILIPLLPVILLVKLINLLADGDRPVR